jgi:hypothetical protein
VGCVRGKALRVQGPRRPRRGASGGLGGASGAPPPGAEQGGGGRGQGHAEGSRGRRVGERERGRDRGRAHLGDPNLAITVTKSPQAQGGRERWKRGICCAGNIE